jgi:hypothetical protein
MHVLAVHGWQEEDPDVAKTIADAIGILIFEARQKIAGGGPAVLASFADPQRAERLAARLASAGVPALVIDSVAVRGGKQPLRARRFVFEAAALRVELPAGAICHIGYDSIDLLLVVSTGSGPVQTTFKRTERKFSLGKTVLAGGVPMTRTVTREETVLSEDRDESIWLYSREHQTVHFDRNVLNYDGFGAAMQLTRSLNFSKLKHELQRCAPQAGYDERLLKRSVQARILGPGLNPEADLDLACEILALSLR